jgi:hypothetical protein
MLNLKNAWFRRWNDEKAWGTLAFCEFLWSGNKFTSSEVIARPPKGDFVTFGE